MTEENRVLYETDDPYTKVIDSLRQNIKNNYDSMLRNGQLIIKELCNNDYKEVAKKKFSKNRSISKLMKLMNEDKTGDLPARSTTYNAVNLAIDYHNLSNDHEIASTYGQLGVSHKVVLTQVSDIETKKVLILETVDKKYTVEELKKRIRYEKDADDSNPLKINEQLDEKILLDCDYWRLRETEKKINELKENLQEKLKLLDLNLDAIVMMLKSRQTKQNQGFLAD